MILTEKALFHAAFFSQFQFVFHLWCCGVHLLRIVSLFPREYEPYERRRKWKWMRKIYRKNCHTFQWLMDGNLFENSTRFYVWLIENNEKTKYSQMKYMRYKRKQQQQQQWEIPQAWIHLLLINFCLLSCDTSINSREIRLFASRLSLTSRNKMKKGLGTGGWRLIASLRQIW